MLKARAAGRLSSERLPDDIAGAVAAVAMRGTIEGVGELPLLRFIAPLRGDMGDDVVGLATRTHRRRPRRLAADDSHLLLPRDDLHRLRAETEWIEKCRVSHLLFPRRTARLKFDSSDGMNSIRRRELPQLVV